MRVLSRVLPGLALAICLPSLSAATAEEDNELLTFKSDYTSLDLDKCAVVDRSAEGEEGPGWAHWRCTGLTDDWPVHVMAGDLRYAVSYGKNGPEERAAGQYFRRFTRLNDTLEWVLERGPGKSPRKPVATILRFFLHVEARERENGKAYDHPLLVVTQLKQGAVCHVAYVDARANKLANLEARKAAYRLAGDFDCAEKAERVGPQTPGILGE